MALNLTPPRNQDTHREQDIATRIARLSGAMGQTGTQSPQLLTELASRLPRDSFDTVRDSFQVRATAQTTSSIAQAAGDFFGAAGRGLGAAASGAGSALDKTWEGWLWLTGDLDIDPETGERVPRSEETEGSTERPGPGAFQRELMSQAALAPSLAFQSPGQGFDSDTWELAGQLSKEISFGESVFHLLAGTDILDPDEMARWADSDYFKMTTGLIHVSARYFLDPDVLAAKGLRATRRNYLIPGISPRPQFSTDPERFRRQLKSRMRGSAQQNTDAWIESLPDNVGQRAQLIRTNLFARDKSGYSREAAHMLAKAPDRQTRHLVTRLMYGDNSAFKELAAIRRNVDEHESLLKQIEATPPIFSGQTEFGTASKNIINAHNRTLALEAQAERMALNRMGVWSHLTPNQQIDAKFLYFNDPSRQSKISAEVSDTISQAADIDTLTGLFQTQSKFLRTTTPSNLRTAARHSKFYKTSPLTAPVRSFTERRPHSMIDAEDKNFSEMFDRMLRQVGLPDKARNALNQRLIDAGTDPVARIEVWDDALAGSWRHIVRDVSDRFSVQLSGSRLDPKQVERAIREEIGLARNHVKRQYAAGNRDLFPVVDELGATDLVRHPLYRSQSPNVVFRPDFPGMRKHLERAASKKWLPSKGPMHTARIRDIPPEIGDGIMRFWKPNVLLRGAWPVRVTGFDEVWRVVAKYGAASALPSIAKGSRNFTRSVSRTLSDHYAPNLGRAGAIRGGVAGAVLGIGGGPGGILGGAAIGASAGTAGFKVMKRLADMERAGVNWNKLGRVGVKPAFGEPGDRANIYFDKASSRIEHSRTLNEDRVHGELISAANRDRRQWETIRPVHPDGTPDPRHLEDWAKHINLQLRGDKLAERILKGDSHDDLVSWLGSPEGIRYARNFQAEPIHDTDMWVSRLREEADKMFPGDNGPALRALALKREVTTSDLTKLYKNPKSRPEITGEALAESRGHAMWQQLMNRGRGFIDRWMDVLGSAPTDELVRYPAFEISYRKYFEDHLDRNFPNWESAPQSVRITGDELAILHDNARRSSLAQVRDLAYDLSERTEMNQLLRHIHPFMNAAQEALSTWAGLALDNPSFATRAVKAWMSVDKIDGLIYVDPDDGSHWLTFPVPEFAKGLVNSVPLFRGALDDIDMVRLPKNGFNLVLQSPLGLGPFVQASVSGVLNSKPVLELFPGIEDTLQPLMNIIMPFGTSRGFIEDWFATYQRRGQRAAHGQVVDFTEWWNGVEANREYYSGWSRDFTMQIAKMQEGEREPIDFDDPAQVEALIMESNERTLSSFALRAFIGFFSPAQPVFESPYWLHGEVLREMQESHDALPPNVRTQIEQEHGTPFEQFLDAHGEELAWVLQSMSRSNDGVPPTIEALKDRKEHEQIIEKYPELGGLILGRDIDSQQAQFSSSVYEYQLDSRVSATSPDPQRELLSPIELFTEPDERVGWIKYSRVMDWIEAERISRGLPNLRVKEAEDLQLLRQQSIARIAREHSAWGRARENEITQPQAAARRRLEAIKAITADPALGNAPHIAPAKGWIKAFETMSNELCKRAADGGAKTLEATSNYDLQVLWETTMSRMVDENVHFGPLYYRWLERTRPSCSS